MKTGKKWSYAKRKSHNDKKYNSDQQKIQFEPQQPVVDIPRLEERGYRRGLIAALDCIIRELR